MFAILIAVLVFRRRDWASEPPKGQTPSARGLGRLRESGGTGSPRPLRRSALPVVVIALGILYPFYVGFSRAFPGIGIAVVILVFTMMAFGLNVVVVLRGAVEFGYVAFYAAARTSLRGARRCISRTSRFTSDPSASTAMPREYIVWLILIIAGLFTTAVGILIGLPTLRLRGDYLAIVTLGFGEIIPQFVRNADEEAIG